MTFDKVERALADIRAGRMVILVDDEDRENEGDLCLAAECITPEAINFMARHARGLICLTLTEERLAELNIPLMVADNTSMYNTAFTVSRSRRDMAYRPVSARQTALRPSAWRWTPKRAPKTSCGQGISSPCGPAKAACWCAPAKPRARWISRAWPGLKPAGVICEIMNDDGTMARMPDLQRFAAEHHLPILSIAELIQYRLAHESFVHKVETRAWEHPQWGHLTLHVYGTQMDERQHSGGGKGRSDPRQHYLWCSVHASHAFHRHFCRRAGRGPLGHGHVVGAHRAREERRFGVARRAHAHAHPARLGTQPFANRKRYPRTSHGCAARARRRRANPARFGPATTFAYSPTTRGGWWG